MYGKGKHARSAPRPPAYPGGTDLAYLSTRSASGDAARPCSVGGTVAERTSASRDVPGRGAACCRAAATRSSGAGSAC